jgi:hypothetical protein
MQALVARMPLASRPGSLPTCAPTDRGQGVLRRGRAQFATLEIAHRFVPDSMLAFSALRNTENGPPFVVWRDSVRLPSFQCGPQLSVSRSLLCRLLAVAARHQPVAADARQHALTLVKRVAGQVKPEPKLPFAIETTIRQLDPLLHVVDPGKRLLSRRRPLSLERLQNCRACRSLLLSDPCLNLRSLAVARESLGDGSW